MQMGRLTPHPTAFPSYLGVGRIILNRSDCFLLHFTKLRFLESL